MFDCKSISFEIFLNKGSRACKRRISIFLCALLSKNLPDDQTGSEWWKFIYAHPTFKSHPPASKVSRTLVNLTERKNPHNPVYGVKEFVCLFVCLLYSKVQALLIIICSIDAIWPATRIRFRTPSPRQMKAQANTTREQSNNKNIYDIGWRPSHGENGGVGKKNKQTKRLLIYLTCKINDYLSGLVMSKSKT